MYQPKKGEEVFEIKPVGVRYKCEHCKKGEMKVEMEPGKDPFIWSEKLGRGMVQHKCTNCQLELLLPKQYPYIEWVPLEEGLTLGVFMKNAKYLDDIGLKHVLERLKDKMYDEESIPGQMKLEDVENV